MEVKLKMVQAHGNGHDYMPEFMGKHDEMRRTLDTQEILAANYASQAYSDHILGADGLFDYKKLNDAETRQSVATQIGEAMEARAAVFNQSGPGLTWMAKVLQTTSLFGTNLGRLVERVNQLRDGFTISDMMSQAGQHKNTLFELLAPSTYAHIPDNQHAFESVINAMGIANKVDPTKARMGDISQLLLGYANNDGSLPNRLLARSPIYIQPNAPAHP